MTMVRGVRILEAPCCGAKYAFPNYVSMNFSAHEYWTDGWREHSLMPNDEGLRRCHCNQFVLIENMMEVGTDDSSDLPFMCRVADDHLPQCIAEATSQVMEVAARLSLWRHLNHGYRDSYRLHRAAEEEATKSAWCAANPDGRTAWQKFLRHKKADYCRPPGSPFTYPSFEPTSEQTENMRCLCELLVEGNESFRNRHVVSLVEVLRELGEFDEAGAAMKLINPDHQGVGVRLIQSLIGERQTAPMRYRI